MRITTALMGLALVAGPLPAQEFIPPDRPQAPPNQPQQPQAPSEPGFFVGVLGFSTRAGAQVNADRQMVLGSTIDIAQLGAPGVRLRPSFEVGFARPEKSLAINLEVMYRFQDDEGQQAVPYIGVGGGYYDNGVIKKGWPTFVLGFELPYTRTTSWLIEFHALDGVDRSRIFIGLATRGAAR